MREITFLDSVLDVELRSARTTLDLDSTTGEVHIGKINQAQRQDW